MFRASSFDNQEAYGFIGREGGPDVFVHHSAIAAEGYKSLQEGDKVQFEIVQGVIRQNSRLTGKRCQV